MGSERQNVKESEAATRGEPEPEQARESSTGERRQRFRRIWYQMKRNPLTIIGILMILSMVFVAIFAPVIAPHPEDRAGHNFEKGAVAPSLEHPMGTDTQGRDILSRIFFGARLSLGMGVVVLGIAGTAGITLGLIAGYVGGLPQAIIMRLTDTFLALPGLILALAVAATLGPSLINLMLAIAFAWWTQYARLVHGEVLSVKQEEFVEASEAIGASRIRVMFREILPNIMSPLSVKLTLDMGFVIIAIAGLAFLGFGAEPPTPDWGVMIAQGRQHVINYWWISVFPGLAISYTVLAFNFLGDGLRDIMDVEVN
jgi:peptide/nickel transport system permease protein